MIAKSEDCGEMVDAHVLNKINFMSKCSTGFITNKLQATISAFWLIQTSSEI